MVMGKNPDSLLYANTWDAVGALVETTRSWTRWGRVFVVVIFFFGVLAGNVADLPPYYIGSYLFALSFAAIVGYLLRVGYAYFQLFTFKCPRCQTRWAGLLRKSPVCESCGLRIYQDS